MLSITTPTGATVSLTTRWSHTYVVLDHPDAPQDMRNVVVGRIAQGAFQPAPLSAYGLTSATLRALADLLDQHNGAHEAPAGREVPRG